MTTHTLATDAPRSSIQADNVTERIVDAVAAATNADALELPPIYDAVDPEALDVLCRHATGTHESIRVEFEFAGCTVLVEARECVEVIVRPPTDVRSDVAANV